MTKKEYLREWYRRKRELHSIAAPLCPCGCGDKLRWVTSRKAYSDRASASCPKILDRPLCACGCGNRTTRPGQLYFSKKCHDALRVKENAVFRKTRNDNAPDCPCGRGTKMKWKRGKYVLCSPSHHGVSARTVELTERQRQLIIGTLLGDGHAMFVRNRVNARLQTRHSTKRQLAYCRWKRQELDSICNADVIIRDTPKAFGKQMASFVTLSHPFILEQALTLYTPIKRVTREYLDQLDDFGLAVWYMDDGSTSQMHTESFTREEQELIVVYLKERWGVDAEIKPNKAKGLEYISFNHPLQLHTTVAKHLIPSMRYKIRRSALSELTPFPEVS